MAGFGRKESPYAVALEPLGRLAKAAKTTLGGPTAEAIARQTMHPTAGVATVQRLRRSVV